MSTLTKYRLGACTALALAVAVAIANGESQSWCGVLAFLGLMLTACILFVESVFREPPDGFPY